MSPTPADLAAVALQLGRAPRAVRTVCHRCGCGLPDVVTTEPRLDDGTPFPTTFYLTCPRAASAIGRLEGAGVMAQMSSQLRDDPTLAAAHRGAHHAYLAARSRLGEVPEIADVSAGGLPDRVKCLHALAAHELAQGPGVDPLGARVVDQLDADGRWGAPGTCVDLAGQPVRLRPATSADLPAYLDIRDAAARWLAEAGIAAWTAGEYAIPAAEAVAAGELLVADLVGVVVGGLRLAHADPEVWPEITDPAAGFVHALVVDRSLSGRGLGGWLLDQAAARVGERGGDVLRLDCWAGNERLRRWYTEEGFTELDVREVSTAHTRPVRVARFVREVAQLGIPDRRLGGARVPATGLARVPATGTARVPATGTAAR